MGAFPCCRIPHESHKSGTGQPHLNMSPEDATSPRCHIPWEHSNTQYVKPTSPMSPSPPSWEMQVHFTDANTEVGCQQAATCRTPTPAPTWAAVLPKKARGPACASLSPTLSIWRQEEGGRSQREKVAEVAVCNSGSWDPAQSPWGLWGAASGRGLDSRTFLFYACAGGSPPGVSAVAPSFQFFLHFRPVPLLSNAGTFVPERSTSPSQKTTLFLFPGFVQDIVLLYFGVPPQ